MKRLLCLLLAVVMTLALGACGKDADSHIDRDDTKRGNEIGDRAYGTSLTEISKDGVALTTFNPTQLGKITVLNFWAYWCGPCVGELPHFNRVAKEYADEVAIIAVHCDELEKAQAFIGANYPNSPIRFAMDDEDDPYGYYELLGGNGSIPYTVVLDADGIIRKTFVGAITYEALVDAIEDCREDEKKAPTTTAYRPALRRGNQVGDVCYDHDLTVITADGFQKKTVDPTAYGKVTVIHFWYSANGPCVADLPYFDAVATKYADDVTVVAVHEMFPENAPAFIAEHYPSSPIVFLSDFIPEDKVGEVYRTGYYTLLGGVNNAYPYTVILNEKGIITHIFSASVTQKELETAVLEALGRM